MNLQRSLLIKMFIVLETKIPISGCIIGFLFSDDLLVDHNGRIMESKNQRECV